MTTVESGVAIGQPYPKHEERATAIHEAGHAVCGHVYMENRLSTRLSIRKRGSSGGHHQAMEIEDRFGSWRSEQFGDADLGPRRDGRRARLLRPDDDRRRRRHRHGHLARRADGRPPRAWRPAPIDLSDRIADKEEREKAEEKVMERFEKLGMQLMHRAPTWTFAGDQATAPSASSSRACSARRSWSPGARSASTRTRPTTSPTRLIAAGEMYGDDVTDLLDECRLVKPEIDVLDEATWPVI